MTVSINQPAYLPWLGYFDRIINSDIHVCLENVKFEKNSYINRNKIRTKEGWIWLTVPVKISGLGQPLIKDVRVVNTKQWCQKHWKSIQNSYTRSEFFHRHFNWFDNFYKQRFDHLIDLLDFSTKYFLDVLNINTKMVYASELSVIGQKSDLILNICKELGATAYLSGPFGLDYLNIHDFEEAGIEVVFQEYRHPQYLQVYPGFEPYMSIIDLIFNDNLGRSIITSLK